MASYRKLDQIGEGGYGQIFRATRDDGQIFALKTLKSNADEEGRRRFQREVRLMSTLQHPNVMPIVACNLSADPPFCVMPLAQYSLRDAIPDIGGDNDRILAVTKDVLRGLAHAHQNGVIHRDLKPENILFLSDEQPVIADFGLGRPFIRDTTTLTATNLGLGTVAYMAPEQWELAKEAGIAADIYALGKIIYEMITGKMPYPDVELSLLNPRQRYIVSRCVERNPLDRFTTAGELSAEIELFFAPPTSDKAPRDRVLQLISEESLGVLDDDQVRELSRQLAGNKDDCSLLLQVVPRVPLAVIQAWVRLDGSRFEEVIRAFDLAVSGNLAFEFTDVVADFYRRVYSVIDDMRLKELIIGRLHDMGFRHNRYHVVTVLGGLLTDIRDPVMGHLAAKALAASPRALEFTRQYTSLSSVLPEIRSALSIEDAAPDDYDPWKEE